MSWAKISARISESEDYAEVYRRSRAAAVLFLIALPHADVFGVLPGNLAVLRGKICPLLPFSDEDLKVAMDVLCECGLLRYYESSSGRPHYLITKYALHQDVRWDRVGRPEYELPADWVPPKALKTAAEKHPASPIAVWLRDRTASASEPEPEPEPEPRRLMERVSADGVPHDRGQLLMTYGDIREAVRKATSDDAWSQTQRNHLALFLIQSIEDKATDIDRDGVLNALKTMPPTLAERRLPEKYLGRLLRERKAEKQAPGSRRTQPASPQEEFVQTPGWRGADQ